MDDARTEYFREGSGAITGIANEPGVITRGTTWEALKKRLPKLTAVLNRAETDGLDPALFLDYMTKLGASRDFRNNPYSPYLFVCEAYMSVDESPQGLQEGKLLRFHEKLESLKTLAKNGLLSDNDGIRQSSQTQIERIDRANELLLTVL